LVTFWLGELQGKIIIVPEVVIEILAMGIRVFELFPDLGGYLVVILNVSARKQDLQNMPFAEIC
jgi:hypothetical protein